MVTPQEDSGQGRRPDRVRLARTAIGGLAWTSVAHFGRQAIQTISTVVLARVLAPSAFGLIGMALVVVDLVQVVRDLGTSAALVHRRVEDRQIESSVFWINLAVAVCTSALFVALAPILALAYREPEVASVLRALSLAIPASALGAVHGAILQRELSFGALARSELCGSAAGSVCAVLFAVAGGGVWALVVMNLVTAWVTSIVLWRESAWRPLLAVNLRSARSEFSYGWKLSAANLANWATRNVDNFLVGRVLGAGLLGQYSMAYKIMLYPIQTVGAVVTRVMFPAYCRMDKRGIRRAYLDVAGAIAFVSFPVMAFIVVEADVLVGVVLGAGWEQVPMVLRILAPVGAFQSVATTVGSLYQATGRTDVMLKWVSVYSLIVVLSFLVGISFGLLGIAFAYALAVGMTAYPTIAIPLKTVGLRFVDFARACAVPLLGSVLVAAVLLVLRQHLEVHSGLGGAASLLLSASVSLMTFGAVEAGLDRERLRRMRALIDGSRAARRRASDATRVGDDDEG